MRRALVAVCCVLLLSACTDDSSSDGPDIKDGGQSSATPTPTTPTEADSLLDFIAPKPVEPKQEFTKASAIAFADYYFKVMYYAYGQADGAPLQAISDAGCRECQQPIKNAATVKGTGGVLIGEGPPTLTDSKVIYVEGNTASVATTLTFPRTTVIDPKTGKQSGDWDDKVSGKTTVGLQWSDDDGWSVLNYQSIYS